MNIYLVLIVLVLLCGLIFNTRRKFKKTKSTESAFLKGFAYPFFFISLVVLLYEVDSRQLPSVIDDVLVALLFSTIIYYLLIESFCFLSNHWEWLRLRILRERASDPELTGKEKRFSNIGDSYNV